jgi:hypothetical protein
MMIRFDGPLDLSGEDPMRSHMFVRGWIFGVIGRRVGKECQ